MLAFSIILYFNASSCLLTATAELRSVIKSYCDQQYVHTFAHNHGPRSSKEANYCASVRDVSFWACNMRCLHHTATFNGVKCAATDFRKRGADRPAARPLCPLTISSCNWFVSPILHDAGYCTIWLALTRDFVFKKAFANETITRTCGFVRICYSHASSKFSMSFSLFKNEYFVYFNKIFQFYVHFNFFF